MSNRWTNRLGAKVWLDESTIKEFEDIFKCCICKGSEIVNNPDFEYCKNREFQEMWDLKEGDCDHCESYTKSECKKGERIPCPNDFCNKGMEFLTFEMFMRRYTKEDA